MWSSWDSVSLERENKHILPTLRQRYYDYVKSYSISKYCLVYVQRSSGKKPNMLHTTGILSSMLFCLLAYLMKSPDIRRSLEHQIICKKYILRCSKFFISGFFGGRKWSSEVIFLKILPNPSAERKAVGQREKMFTLCLLSKSLKANACT